jgi:hypothetical protein
LRGEEDESANLIEVNSPPAYSHAREVLNAGRPGASSNSFPRPAPNRPAPRASAEGAAFPQAVAQKPMGRRPRSGNFEPNGGAAAVRSPLHPPQRVHPRHPVAEHQPAPHDCFRFHPAPQPGAPTAGTRLPHHVSKYPDLRYFLAPPSHDFTSCRCRPLQRQTLAS